ncbi:hypothetical protein [Sphingobium yanoikuyae]|uniref:hypothetical protein n=1 Tax=Sphingobium yanoikuyae TaxID=13690 RepID=UPI000A48751D|nr:hypothetical protein [Sphingobium yanoikuyae]
MTTYQPYFYVVGWPELNWYYAGVEIANRTKVANPTNLFRTDSMGARYTTSSWRVNRLAKWFGDPTLIETYPCSTAEEATDLERQFLALANPLNNQMLWLNRNLAGHIIMDESVRTKLRKPNSRRNGKKLTQDELCEIAERREKAKAAKARTAQETSDLRAASIRRYNAEHPNSRYHNAKLYFDNGEGKTAREWAELSGIVTKHQFLMRMQKGWSVSKAITTPVRQRRTN